VPPVSVELSFGDRAVAGVRDLGVARAIDGDGRGNTNAAGAERAGP